MIHLNRKTEYGLLALHYLSLRPDSFNGWFNRGVCLRHVGQWREATYCFERAVHMRPSSISARHLLE